MRNVVVTEFITLDGVFEDPGGAEKTEHGGWSFKFWSEESGKFKYDELVAADAMLLGRITYQGFAAAWPEMTDEAGFADRMNSLPKYVASRTLDKLEWQNSHLIEGDVVDAVSALKQQEGQNILVGGSGQLANVLLRADLVDELRFLVSPLVLGSGRRFFEDGSAPRTMELVEAVSLDMGVLALTYRRQRGAG
ncbi:MAG TPA: dihydrofolate reductase family protein [Gaiellales bacterium]